MDEQTTKKQYASPTLKKLCVYVCVCVAGRGGGG